MKDLKNIPENPGVYLMKNSNKVIYVGKAKNLKKRVNSYFIGIENHSIKTYELVKNIEDIDFIITNSEVDALILENNLIKKYKPKYNIMLKDQKTYPHIKITKEKFPKIEIIRSTKKLNLKNGDYFGPYPMGIFKVIRILKRIFKIRDCSRDMSKIYDRPCLKYFMKLCLGPCVYKNIETDYNQSVLELKELLKGKTKELLKTLKNQMKIYSENMEYERAIIFRNKIDEINGIMNSQVSEYGKAIDEDIFIYKEGSKKIFICVLNVREGKIIGKNLIEIDYKNKIEEKDFNNILVQYYTTYPLPKNIIFESSKEEEFELFREWVLKEKKINIKFYYPKIKCRRKELLHMAELNLNKYIEDYSNRKSVLENALIELKENLSLKKIPNRIECFDISNIQGKDAVGSMSVAVNGKASKKDYRKFKITVKDTPDDYLMMKEVLIRRYSKLEIKELPDLILIDGGKGQLGMAEEVLKSIGKIKYLDIISIAKREEEIFKVDKDYPFIFSKRDEQLKILQRLRDESHRFGITYHRSLRSKRVLKSELDDIEGIGKKRREILIKKFKTVKNVFNASLEELKEVIPENVALKIKQMKGEKNEKNINNR